MIIFAQLLIELGMPAAHQPRLFKKTFTSYSEKLSRVGSSILIQ
jgi:hypothetical protein